MYFNRKNAEQKNWRMIKKGKHFLFGCSLVFAVGASLATQVVHANTAETTVANNSTTGDVTPTPNGDGKTYEAPAAVAEIKSEVATTPAVAAKLDGETAKEVKALDKTKLENYIAEIEAKLANGTYESKTEESVAVLKADLEAAKATLANATTQDEITKAYSKLVTTANTKLKNKPVEKKETPAVDATNGQPTVGKKAENTEKKSESNSIENTGSNDSRNGKALDKNNAFRAEVAYSEGTNAAANGHSDTYILNDVNKATSTDDAVNAVSRVTNYKVKYNKDASGKITSLDWLVFYNDHAENLSNTYNTDGGDVYRNFIQIPAEVNMPTSITRAKYNSPIQGKLNPKTKKLERTKPDGSALSSSVTFENPAPATAAGLPLDKKDTFSLASGWESGIYGRSIEKLAGQEDRYFKSAASNSSPRTKELLDNVALNDKRLIVDRSTTGGSGYDGYAWSFRTEVPATTSNEQLKDMKVVFGMMRSATAGANAGFANIATNPIKMWQSDVSTPTAKDQTVKVGQKPDATKSIGNLDTLPKGTTVKYKDAVDTRTPGEKRATAVVTYPDKSTKEVPVKVIVEKEAVAPAKPVTPKPEAPKPSTPAPDAATNKPAAGAATNKPAPGAATNKPAAGAATSAPEIVNDLAGKASTPADVTVKAPAGSTVKLYNTDGVVIGEAVANAQGVATVHPTNSLPAGKITATSTPTGGKESAKSTPITITASPVTVKDGGVTGNDDTRLLVSRSEITVYPGDKIDVDVVAQATALEKFSVEKNPLAIRGVEPTGGYLGASNGATIRQRDAKYSGTVAMDQPAGETVVTFYAKNRDHGTNVSRDLKVIVLETAKKYEPVAGTKVDIVDSNGVSGAEKNKIIEAVKAANPSLPANSQYSVDEKGNLTITYPDGSKDKIAAAYLVNPGADAATSAPEIVNDLAGKASTPADVTVKAPAGSTVKLYNTDGVVIGEAVANAQGVATVHPTNSLPAGAITATSTPAGGKESAKSTPITVTASPLTVKDGGVTGNNDTRLLVSKSEITVYPGDKIDVDVVAQATALGKFSVEKNPLAIKGVEPTGGYLDDPRGSTIRQRDAKYSGTVAMDQPAGSTSVIFHAKNRDKPTTIYRELIVNVLETAKKYEPVAGTKLDVANSNNLSEDDKNKVIASVKAANPSLPADSQYSVDEKGNLTITYPDGSKDKIAAAYLVNPAPTDADKNTPTAKPQTVNKGTTPKAEDSIGNIKDLPKGTKVAFKAPVDTATPGEKDATVVVTYPDGSNEEVPVKVTVKAPSSASTTPTAPATPAAPVVAPTVEIPYSNKDTKEVYVYAGEENSFDIKFKDDSGKIASATVRQGGNKAFADVAGEANTINTQYGFKANVINAETPATEKAPAVITYSGTPAATDGLAKDKLEAATKGENPEGMALGWRYATATDKDGAFIENKAVGSSTATDPGAFRVMLKGQTQKYDIATPTEKVTVADPANVTDADLAKIKEKLQLEYSKNNDDANLADKKGKAVSDKDAKIQSVTKDDKGNLVVTYKDGSQDKKPLSEFVTKETTAVAPTVEIPYSNKDTKEVYVYAGEENSFDIKFKDDSGKIASATVRQGGNKAFADVAGEANTINTQYGFKANVINAETPATEKAPAVITYSGTPAATDGLAKDKLEAATKGENPEGMALGWRYATATDKDGAFIENKAVGSSTATDPGAFRVMLKGQTQKYDIATPTEKVTVADPANVTDADLAKIKEKLQLEYSQNNDDANLADKKGQAVADKDAKIQSVTKDDKGNLVVTYKDGSQDKKPLSEFVTKKPTDADKNESPSKPEIKTDLTGKAGTKTPVEVTATPGSKVELFDKDGNKIGEGVAGKDGKATITPTVELPAGDVTAKETTPAGKVSEASTPAKATPTKDTTTPSKPEIKTDLTGKAGTKTPVEVTATPGSKVELFDKDGNKIGEGVAGKDGKATITPTVELPAGDVTAKATDSAGNVSQPSAPEKATEDTKAPAKPEIKTDLTDKAGTKTPVEVTAEPGSKVELFDKDGNKIGEGVADENGKATITPTVELPAGDVTAKATDPAGNVSEPSSPEKATEDTKAPAKPEIKTDLTDKAGTKTPVEVTAEPGSKVELFDKDGNKIGEGVAGKDGKATITPTVELPAGDVTAKETTPAGKVSEASTPAKATPTKDTTTPSKPEIKTDLTDKAGTKTPVEVTAEPGSKVELFDKDGNKIGEGVAGKDGKATITPTVELPAGDVTAKETTPAGKVSEASTPAKATPTKDTTTPSKPEIKTDLTGKAGTKTPVEVTATPGSKVELFDKDGNKIGEGVAGKDGKATITPTVELPAGDVTAKETTPAGKVSEASTPAKATPTKDTTTPSKPEIKTDLTGKAGTKTPVEVTAEPGSKVELFDKDGNKIGEGVAGKDGKATITPTVELPAGDVTAKATDSAGNVSQPSAPEKATEDTKAPAKPEIKTDLTDKAGTKTPVEVTAEPGSKVELFDKDGNKIGEGVAGKDGKATITPTVELPAGDVTAKATDSAGNVSQPSAPEKATEDTKAPAKPEIKTDLTDKAGTKTPVEVTAEPGSKVELFDKDGNKIGEGVADENGKATITPTVELPAGDVTAKATDPAGNVSEPSSPEKATEDTKAPAKPEIKTDLTDKAGTKTPVEVTAEPGSKVELFDKDGNKIGEGVAGKDGKATITPTVELPAGDVTAKATDSAGNVSQPSAPEKATEDTKAPAKPEIKTDLTDKAGTKTPVEVTAEPGSKVELFDKDGNKIGEGVAGKDGKATITPTVELPAGDVTAKETTPAGKVSEASTPAKATPTKDTTTPSKPEIKTDLTGKAGTKTPVEVTAEPGSKVELFDKDGNKIGEGVAGKDGKATITPTVELPAGDVTAKATDSAGNVSQPSAPEKATEDTKAPAKPEIKTDLTDKAGTKTPVEVTAEPGSKVELFDKDGNKIGEGVAGKDGKATITPTVELPAGDVTAKATDSAGNVSQPSAPEKATEDTKAPAKPEIKTDLTDKAGTKTPVEVTAEPGSKVELFDKDGNKIGEGVADENGKATITPTVELPAGDVTAKATDPAGNVSEPSSPEKATEDTKAPAKPAVTPVVDPSNLTEAEKAKVADEVKKSNPTVTDVKVGKDGTTTVTFPDGTTAVISSGDTVKKSSDNVVKDPAVTPVVDPSNLTEAEKAKVAEAVKKSNPTVTDVKVGKDGTTTVTFPDGTTAVIPSGDTVKESSDKAVKDPAVTPVVDPSNLTEAEKAKVADEVKKSNPTVTDVKVGKDGTTTVTFPDGTTAVIPSGNAVKKSSDKAVKDPAVTPVVDPSNLTEAEKAKVADEVKKSNPTVTDVKVGKDGTTTVTFPDGTTAVIPSGNAVKKSSDKAVKDPAVTPVVDPSNLTEAEKAKVADEVKKSNPTVTDVKVGKDGTTTVTFPDGTTAVIPSGDTVKKSSDKAVKDPAVTPVVDPSNLTEAEKAKVAEAVKKSNPTVTDVKVGKDGTTTVTFPDGTTAVIPSGDTVKKSSDKAVKDPAVTPVVDPSNLTEAEKAKVADEVKKSNPTVTDVKVGKDGTTTVTFPDGTTAVIPSGNAVKKSSDKAVKDPAVTPVVDPSNLTEAEKAKVADEVKKSNPTVTDVKVGKDGTTTVTFPDGTTAVIPSGNAVKKSSDKAVKDPAVTPVVDPSNLTEAEKAKVADEVKKSNPTVTDVKVGKDGTTTVTFPDGTTAVIPSGDTVKKSSDKAVKDPAVTPVVDPSNLTEAEKAKVAEAVKKSNPTATDVKVGKDGTTTVTFPDGTTAVIPADKAVTSAEQGSHAVVPAGKAVTSTEQGSHAATPAKKAGAKELPNTGTADSTVAMVAAAASALLGLGLAGRRRKEDEEA